MSLYSYLTCLCLRVGFKVTELEQALATEKAKVLGRALGGSALGRFDWRLRVVRSKALGARGDVVQ